MNVGLIFILSGIICVIAAFISFKLGVSHRKKIAESTINSAEQEAKKILSEAISDAQAKKNSIIIEGKDEVHKMRTESEKEFAEKRKDIQRQEHRILQREESLDKKIDNLDAKNEELTNKSKLIDEKLKEIDDLKQKQFEALEKISGFTLQQAKEYLLQNLDEELTHEKAVKIMEFEQKVKDESEKKAREIISLAIQRCASDHVAEATVSVVPLPNDEMKGRIIGREGRNIRAI